MLSTVNIYKGLAIKEDINLTLIEENQNQEYEGFRFEYERKIYRSRLAKKTPKKKGYFVAFYEKDNLNVNQAFSDDDPADITLVSIIDGNLKGIFIFPKEALKQHGILKTKSQKGKMAIRVYPSWEKDLNATATRTQKWQIEYFKDLSL
ncbi:MAG: MepB family protein [Erysipelothrix sp.]